MCRCSDPAIFILTYLIVNDQINDNKTHDIPENVTSKWRIKNFD